MHKSTALYLSTLAVLAGGLWTVFALGSRLEAPTEIAGTWRSVGTVENASPDDIKRLDIKQSGRFLTLSINGGKPAAVRMGDERITSGGSREIKLRGEKGVVRILAAPEQDVRGLTVAKFEFKGERNITVLAEREAALASAVQASAKGGH